MIGRLPVVALTVTVSSVAACDVDDAPPNRPSVPNSSDNSQEVAIPVARMYEPDVRLRAELVDPDRRWVADQLVKASRKEQLGDALFDIREVANDNGTRIWSATVYPATSKVDGEFVAKGMFQAMVFHDGKIVEEPLVDFGTRVVIYRDAERDTSQ